MFYNQRTLAGPVKCEGVGVHSGKPAKMVIKPAPPNHGIKFVRTDLMDHPSIPALFRMVTDTSMATVLGKDGVIVSTVEHILACLAGLSVDNAVIELDSYEVPIMDGSALPFAEAISKAGIVEQDAKRFFFIIKKPLVIEDGDRSVGNIPLSLIQDFLYHRLRSSPYRSTNHGHKSGKRPVYERDLHGQNIRVLPRI